MYVTRISTAPSVLVVAVFFLSNITAILAKLSFIAFYELIFVVRLFVCFVSFASTRGSAPGTPSVNQSEKAFFRSKSITQFSPPISGNTLVIHYPIFLTLYIPLKLSHHFPNQPINRLKHSVLKKQKACQYYRASLGNNIKK